MEEVDTVEIGGATIKLKPHRDLAICFEIVQLAMTNETRACAAALGACWASAGPPKAQYGGNPSEYGKGVLNDLLGRGIPGVEIMNAGRAAWLMLSARLPRARAVQEQEAFSEADGEASPGQ